MTKSMNENRIKEAKQRSDDFCVCVCVRVGDAGMGRVAATSKDGRDRYQRIYGLVYALISVKVIHKQFHLDLWPPEIFVQANFIGRAFFIAGLNGVRWKGSACKNAFVDCR